MNTQKSLRFSVSRLPGETATAHATRERLINKGREHFPVPPEKLFADLLKRQAKRVMADITDCPANMLPAHVARLNDLRDIVRHAINHSLVPDSERELSGRQLLFCYTLADYLAALELTKAANRAPAFINSRDEAVERIERKIDLLAGLFAGSRALNAVLDEAIAADESEVAA
jgi:hypothetical protein